MKKVVTHTLIYALGPQLPKLINILVLPLITPFLTTQDYGIYGVLIAYIGALSALKDLGFLVVISNSFYKYPTRFKGVWQRLYSFLSFWNIVLAAIVSLVVYLVLPPESKSVEVILLIALPIGIFDNTIFFGNRYFQLMQRPGIVVTVSIVSSVVAIVANYYFIAVLKSGYVGWFWAAFLSTVTSFAFIAVLMRGKGILNLKLNFNLKWLRKKSRVAFPTIPHTYSSYLLDSSDRVILGLFNLNMSSIGLYNLGYTFGQYFNIINNSLGLSTGAIYLEYYSYRNKEYEEKIRNTTFYLQIGILAVAVLGGLWLKEVFGFLIRNENLRQAYSISILILFSYTGKVFYMAAGNKLIYYEKTRSLWKISFVGGVINVVLNVILISYIGIYGAVVATFIANMYLYFSCFYLRDYREIGNNENYYPVFWIVLIGVTTLATYLLRDIAVLYKIILTLILSALVVYIALQLRNRLDRKQRANKKDSDVDR